MEITVYAFCATRISLTVSWVCLLSIPTIYLNHSEYSVFFLLSITHLYRLLFDFSVSYPFSVIPTFSLWWCALHTSLTPHPIPILPFIFRHTLGSVLFSEKRVYMSFSIYNRRSSWPSINSSILSLCLKIKFWQSLGLYLQITILHSNKLCIY